MTSLAQNYSLATQYSALDHPSEPNYLALIAGQTFTPNSTDDRYHVFNALNLVDRIESAGLSWKAYSESASGPCDTHNPDIRHIPFLFFADVANNPSRCDRVVPTTAPADPEILSDLSSTSTASNFMWLTPNDCDNMHDSCNFGGDAYLAGLVPKILASRIFTTQNAALFVVFDEGSRSYPSDYVYASLSGPVVKRHYQSQRQYSHYSFLKTVETVWNLGTLTTNDANAPPMTEFFSNNPATANNAISGFLENSWVLIGIGAAVVASILLLVFRYNSRRRSGSSQVGTALVRVPTR